MALDIEEARIQAQKRAEILSRARELQFKEVRPLSCVNSQERSDEPLMSIVG